MSKHDYYRGPAKDNRFRQLTPPGHGNKGTAKRIDKAKKMAELEARAKAEGKTIAQVTVEEWSK